MMISVRNAGWKGDLVCKVLCVSLLFVFVLLITVFIALLPMFLT